MTESNDAALSPSARGLVSYDLAEARENFARRSFIIDHELTDHPLFSLDALADLADRLPQELVEHNRGSVGAVVPGGDVPRLDLTPGELVRGIETNDSWVVLPIMRADPGPGYREVYHEIIAGLGPMVPGGVAATSGHHAVIFIASGGSTTPTHIDAEVGFLLHMRGEKRLSIGGFPDATKERERLEDFFTGGHRNTEGLPTDVRHFDLEPGQAVHVPPLKPHCVSNGAEVTISMSVGFQTEANLRRAYVHTWNGRVRKLGLSPKPFGENANLDRVKASVLWGGVKARRLLSRQKAAR